MGVLNTLIFTLPQPLPSREGSLSQQHWPLPSREGSFEIVTESWNPISVPSPHTAQPKPAEELTIYIDHNQIEADDEIFMAEVVYFELCNLITCQIG